MNVTTRPNSLPGEASAPDDIGDLLQRLFAVIEPYGRMLTALSGGVDSTLVAAAARHVLGKDNAPAAVGDSASLPRHELDDVRRLADELDLDLHVVQPGEQNDPLYQQNDGRRCYSCKTHLYEQMHALAGQLAVPYLANGANTEDAGDYRPGLQAAAEAKVISPLVEAGLNKTQVRACALAMGLSNWDKPAAACLASRVPYGTAVTPETLTKVEDAENVLRELGFRGFRVRHHDPVARLEIPWSQVDRLMDDTIRQQVIDGVKAAGYHYVSLDLEGFRSGSGNVMLKVQGRSQSEG